MTRIAKLVSNAASTSSQYLNKHVLNFMVLYYILFTLYNVISTVMYTGFSRLTYLNIPNLYFAIRIIIFVIFFFHILTLKLRVQTYLVCIFVVSCTVVSTLVSGSWNVLLLLLFLLCGKDVNIKILSKCILWSNITIMTFTAIANEKGIITSPIGMTIDGAIKVTYGFNHRNSLGMCILTTCCAYAVLRFRDFKIYDIIVYGFAFYICDALISSRTAAVIILLIAISSLVISVKQNRTVDSLVIITGLILFILAVLFSIWIMVYYNSSIPWMAQFNTFMSGRLELANYYYETYHIHLFGYDFSSMQQSYKDYETFICDNAYNHVILQSGIVVFAIIIIGYGYILLSSFIYKCLTPCVYGLIIFAVVSFSESSGLFISNNFCLVSLVAPLLGINIKEYLECDMRKLR